MYLNYFSEHPESFRKSISYSQFLGLKLYILRPNIYWKHKYICICFLDGGNIPMTLILKAWMKPKKSTRGQLLHTENSEIKDVPLMFITTYNRANPNFKELISKHWAYLSRSSATRDFGKRDFIITYRKPPSLKDKLVRARITEPRHKATKGCKIPNTCKYCKKISQSGKIKNVLNNKNYNTMMNDT